MLKDINSLREQIRVYGLERLEEKIVQLAKPAIKLMLNKIDDDAIPIGASKLGGHPDLPVGFQWKYYGDNPLTFIGQFRLSEMASYDRNKELPESGVLYFFFEADDVPIVAEASQLLYIEDETTQLVRTPHPVHRGKYRTIDALPSHSLSFESALSVPFIFPNEEKDWELDFSEKELDAYFDFYEANFPAPQHQFLGYDSHIQYYSEWYCVIQAYGLGMTKTAESKVYRYSDEQVAFIRAEMKIWKFLFQIDTDDNLNVMWGDMGMLYVCISQSDLDTKQFDKAQTILQCV